MTSRERAVRQAACCFGAMLALFIPATPAVTADGPFCGSRADVMSRLEEEFGEVPIGAGIVAGGRLLELLASNDGRSFSVLVTAPPNAQLPDGLTCLIAAGQGWRNLMPAYPSGPGA